MRSGVGVCEVPGSILAAVVFFCGSHACSESLSLSLAPPSNADKPDLREEPQDGTGVGEGYCMELWGNQTADYVRAFTRPDDPEWVVAGNSIGGLTALLVAAELGETTPPPLPHSPYPTS